MIKTKNMAEQFTQQFQQFNQIIEQSIWLFTFMLVWSLIWKGIALWKAARSEDKFWFVAILLVNTIGVLEIIYIFFLSKKKTTQIEN